MGPTKRLLIEAFITRQQLVLGFYLSAIYDRRILFLKHDFMSPDKWTFVLRWVGG